MYFDKHTALTTKKTNSEDKFPHYADDNLPSQNSRPFLPRIFFDSAFDTSQQHSHAGLDLAEFIFKLYLFIPFLQNWHSSFIHDCLIVTRKN